MKISNTCTKEYTKKLLIDTLASQNLIVYKFDSIILPKCIKVEEIKKGLFWKKTYYRWTWEKVGYFEIDKNVDNNNVCINIWYEKDKYIVPLYGALQQLTNETDISGYVEIETTLHKHWFVNKTFVDSNLPVSYEP